VIVDFSVCININNKVITHNSTNLCRIGLCDDVEPQGV